VSQARLDEQPVFICIVRDATERLRAEAERLQHERDRIELQKEREIIDLKERFIHMVTHEFRTPLSVIHSSCQIIERYHDHLTVDKQLERVATIKGMSEYMVTLLDDAMEVARGNAGRLAFSPGVANLAALCAAVLEHAQLSSKKYHRFTLETEGALDAVLVDEKLLQSILVNLIQNAVKYTPDGGEVTLRALGEADAIVLEVRDTGIGIPESDQPRVFEAFHRADNAFGEQGTGLGLTIVKNAVDAHGGSISFTSVVGKGTTFTVRLPRL
jgi:signal transduction histidine kinase